VANYCKLLLVSPPLDAFFQALLKKAGTEYDPGCDSLGGCARDCRTRDTERGRAAAAPATHEDGRATDQARQVILVVAGRGKEGRSSI